MLLERLAMLPERLVLVLEQALVILLVLQGSALQVFRTLVLLGA
jgi:hypothetical protein